jgi:multicomponent Na+:H+ antiporter subunit G
VIGTISTSSLFIGTALCMVGVIGILRMPDFMNRFHAGTVITTLGTGFLLLPVGLASIESGDAGYAKSALLLLAAVWLSGAVGSHAIARAMFRRGIKPENLVRDQMGEKG